MTNYTIAAEGFDIYPTGNIVANYPWFVPNAAYVGQISSGTGSFSGNSARFNQASTTTVTVGTEYEFLSQAQQRLTLVTPGSLAIVSFNGWVRVDTAPANGTFNLLSLGTSANSTQHIMLMGLSSSTAAGNNLMFARNIITPTTNPYLFSITLGQYYWVQVTLAWLGTGEMYATYSIDGGALATDARLTWTSDAFSSGYIINRLKFWASTSFSWQLDDMVLQTVSNADSNWPIGLTAPRPSSITSLGPRRIYTASAISNGSTNQWTPSAGANYQAATDPTGATFVTANAFNQVDLYKWSLGTDSPFDISSVVYRGSSVKYRNIKTAFKTPSNPVVVPGGIVAAGANKYVGVIETDGTSAWTKTSIEAAEFGQSS